MVQDISEILKLQMTEENCSPLCALLTIGGYNYEHLQSTEQMASGDTNDEQRNKLGARC